MLFDELRLKNVGPYVGEHRLALTPLVGGPVVLVGGLNGAGKTTLLDAIQLALYGKRARCSNRGGLAYDQFLRRTISRTASADDGGSVELMFHINSDGAEHTYRVRRSFTAAGHSAREHLTVHRDGHFDPVLTDSWDEHVEELLPLEVASLFFFDGEKIEALADPRQMGTVIGTAVRSLFGLHLVDRLQADLVALERRKRAERFDDTGKAELNRIEALLEAHEEHREAAFLARAEARTAVDRARLRLERAEQMYRTEGGELFEASDALATRRTEVAEAMRAAEDALRDVAAGVLPLALVEPLLTRVEQEADRTGGLDATRLTDVLAERDRALIELLTTKRVRQSTVAAAEAHLAADREYRCQTTALHDAASGDAARHLLRTALPDAKTIAARWLAHLRERQAEHEYLDRQLAAVPDADALAPARTERDAAVEEHNNALAVLQERENDLASLTRLRDETARERDRVLVAEAEAALAQSDADRLADHAGRVRATLDVLRERMVARHSATIEAAILDSLQRLLHKHDLIGDLRLDPTSFALTLYGSSGNELPAEVLSAGERQLLAVAILWGLARASGRRLPMVVDTPLGRLDSEHRRRLVERYFPQAAQQVILLSTDAEVDRTLLAHLAPHVGRVYRLDGQPNGTTTIVEGYFWEEASDVA